ncbi:MAG TPA: sigma-70 family RNA polymerase sigma factor [Gemmatimonadaceae bacterium]|nr:sigma-70 family RNA polymerase sigma factor [Gemmatimonadaceae bacterium]
MDEHEMLAQQFETYRDKLHSAAYRMLGSTAEAEDAVQEAWLRVSNAGTDGVDNLGGWLTTVVGRVCLDKLRARRAHAEESLDGHEPEPDMQRRHEWSPETDVELADSVGLALLVVLEALQPAERVAFVLHDMFDLTFDEIAPIVGRTPVATRQLASRARHRVQGVSTSDIDRSRKQEVAEAFIAAARGGDFEALVAVLDPDVVLRGDAAAIQLAGSVVGIRGAASVAEFFKGKAQACVPALVDGDVGLMVPLDGRILVVLELRFVDGKISAIDAVADRDSIAALELEQLSWKTL